MKKLLLFCIILILISNCSFSQIKLDIEIVEFRNNNGNVMLQLFDGAEKILLQVKNPIIDQKCSFSISDLNHGKYAVRYYHDENKNGKMDTNLVGKPTEGYGFSNNIIGKFGPPAFEKWLFEIAGNKKIILKPTY